jgi:hypothetical protein
MKTVGKRKPTQDIEARFKIQELARDLRQGKPYARRGVYRFKTFEEAQVWWLTETTRRKVTKKAQPPARRRSKT